MVLGQYKVSQFLKWSMSYFQVKEVVREILTLDIEMNDAVCVKMEDTL